MDVSEAICKLRGEIETLKLAIGFLEDLRYAPPDTANSIKPRRGRKSMPEKERRQVSERVKQYWARRREAIQTDVV